MYITCSRKLSYLTWNNCEFLYISGFLWPRKLIFSENWMNLFCVFVFLMTYLSYTFLLDPSFTITDQNKEGLVKIKHVFKSKAFFHLSYTHHTRCLDDFKLASTYPQLFYDFKIFIFCLVINDCFFMYFNL